MPAPREHMVRATDGTPLFVADWPAERAQAQHGGIVLMHGLGEYCGRYAHLARFFNQEGWSVRAFDHRGHGRSAGPRGDVPQGDTILHDAKVVVDDFAQHLDVPPLLFGHSMGGLFAARFATGKMSPLRGLILSSPALALFMSDIQKLLLKTLGAVAPGLRVSNGLKSRYLTHDPVAVQAYDKDPLVHSKISARLLNGMLDAIGFSQSHAAVLAIPTLMVVAGDDRLVDVAGSQAFFAQLALGIGTLHLYHDFYHEIFNETDAQGVFRDVAAWLANRQSSPAASRACGHAVTGP
jgi:alpha-beta hydrolase superfamily lysophospholipase